MEDEIIDMREEVRISKIEHGGATYKVFIDQYIGDPEEYRNVLDLLEAVTEEDQVIFIFNTPGGNAAAAIMLRGAILQTKAHTLARIVGQCCSAGPIIALACDNTEVYEHSLIMLHGAQLSVPYGGASQVKATVEYMHTWNKRLLQDVFEGFLTEEEIQHLLDETKDVYMTAEEYVERLHTRGEVIDLSLQENDED